jgi:hypothetical protein
MAHGHSLDSVIALLKGQQTSPGGWHDPAFTTGSGGSSGFTTGGSGSGGGDPWWAPHPPPPPSANDDPTRPNGNTPPPINAPMGSGAQYTGHGNHARPDSGGGQPYTGGDPFGSANQPGSTHLTNLQVGHVAGGLWDLGIGMGGSTIGNWVGQHVGDGQSYPMGHGQPGSTEVGFAPGHGGSTVPGVVVHYGDQPIGTGPWHPGDLAPGQPSRQINLSNPGNTGSVYYGPSRGTDVGSFGDNFVGDFNQDEADYWNTMHPDQGLGGAGRSTNYGGGAGGGNMYRGTGSTWDWGGYSF